MKTILCLSLVLGCNLITNAHQTVKSSDIDNLHFGDSIHYDLVDASKISAINLTGSLWDFPISSILVKRKRFVLSVIWKGMSSLSSIILILLIGKYYKK